MRACSRLPLAEGAALVTYEDGKYTLIDGLYYGELSFRQDGGDMIFETGYDGDTVRYTVSGHKQHRDSAACIFVAGGDRRSDVAVNGYLPVFMEKYRAETVCRGSNEARRI